MVQRCDGRSDDAGGLGVCARRLGVEPDQWPCRPTHGPLSSLAANGASAPPSRAKTKTTRSTGSPVAAAAALAFARSMGDFGATLMIAGDIPGRTQTASIAIFDAVESGNTKLANTLVLVISVVTALIVFLANRLERRRP